MEMVETQICWNILQEDYTFGWRFGVKIIIARKNEQTGQITSQLSPRETALI